ncbi:YceI family protein [Flavobacterium artemisiae]|uniref:YceI family protein n=1 Tax=Flavobacterium artemisiae TaxID=2126556 RepID=A0ABW4HEV7_9FLAO
MKNLGIIGFLGLVLFCCLGSTTPPFNNDDVILVINKIEIKIKGKSTVGDYNCDNSLIKNDSIFLNLNKKNSISAQIPMAAFDCKNRIMTKDLQSTVKVKKYPNSFVTISEIKPCAKNYRCNLTFAITDKTLKYKDFILKTSDNKIQGSFNLNFSDIGLEPPVKMGGLIKVKDEIVIDFTLYKN